MTVSHVKGSVDPSVSRPSSPLKSPSSSEHMEKIKEVANFKGFLPSKFLVVEGHYYHVDGPLDNLSITSISEFNENIKEMFQEKIASQFSPYELETLIASLAQSLEGKEKLQGWMISLSSGKEESFTQVKSEMQETINENMHFKDTLKIAFHAGIEKWKGADGKGRATLLVKELGKTVFGPLILMAKSGRLVAVKERREHFCEKIKSAWKNKSFDYSTRAKLAKLAIRIGITSLVGSVVAAEVASLGILTPVLAVFGGLAAAGILGLMANNIAGHKSAALTLAELLGESVDAGVRGAVFGAVAGGFAHLAGISGAQGGEEASLSMEHAQEVGLLGAKGAHISHELVEGAAGVGAALMALNDDLWDINEESLDRSDRISLGIVDPDNMDIHKESIV